MNYELELFRPFEERDFDALQLMPDRVLSVDQGSLFYGVPSGEMTEFTAGEIYSITKTNQRVDMTELVGKGEIEAGRNQVILAPREMVWAGTYTRPRFAVIPNERFPSGIQIFTEIKPPDINNPGNIRLKVNGETKPFYEALAFGTFYGNYLVNRLDNVRITLGSLGVRLFNKEKEQ